MIYVTNEDKPGFIGSFAGLLGDAKINIATFHLGRIKQGGDAIALVEVDGAVPADVLSKVQALPQVKQAKALRIMTRRFSGVLQSTLILPCGKRITSPECLFAGVAYSYGPRNLRKLASAKVTGVGAAFCFFEAAPQDNNMRSLSLRLTHKITAIGVIGVMGVILVGGIHLYGETRVWPCTAARPKDARNDRRIEPEDRSRVAGRPPGRKGFPAAQ